MEIFTAWLECWLISYVPKLMRQPKWFGNSRDVKIGDIVLFLKNSCDVRHPETVISRNGVYEIHWNYVDKRYWIE